MSASPWVRRIEIALWIVGVSLVGIACASAFDRWSYQHEQERALFERAPARPVAVSLPKTPAPVVGAITPPPVKSDAAPSVIKSQRKAVAPTPSALGLIEIPSADIRAIVADGADDKTLARAVGRVPGSARPGEEGNMVLAGHRDSFFRGLKNVSVNDVIRLKGPSETLEYRVSEIVIVDPADTGILRSRGREEITLVTCYPFRFVGTAPERFIVKAERVN